MVNVPEGGGGGNGGGGHGGHPGSGGSGSGHHHHHRQMRLNPPFDHRMHRIGTPVLNPQKLKRGWIETTKESSDNYRVDFLFNPSELGVTHGIDPSMPSPIQHNKNAAPGTAPLFASINSSLSVDLLFDRTYELWSPRVVNYATKLGVYADVAAFYQYLNMVPKSYNGAKEESLFSELIQLINPFDDPTPWETIYPQYPMRYQPSYLYIGPRLKYRGYIDNLSITYTHWSHKMVPQRCRVSISFQILPDPKVIKGSQPSDAPFTGTTNSVTLGQDWNHQFYGTPYADNVGAGVL
jgi:hypothetical protein